MLNHRAIITLSILGVLTTVNCHSLDTRGRESDDDDDGDQSTSSENPQVLIISLDGFRHDFTDDPSNPLPNLQRLYKEGVKAKWMTASYATKTFPNHHSINTGLYEESHGIVANKMFDPDWSESFDHCSSPACAKWYQGTALWNVNEILMPYKRAKRHGDSHQRSMPAPPRRSGVIYWPGIGSGMNGRQPTHCDPFVNEDRMTLQERMDKMLNWFTNDTMPINFGMLYFEEPDATCHRHGPESAEVKAKLKDIDNDFGYLLSELERRKLFDLNLIILSDHGFTDVQEEKIYLSDCIGDNPKARIVSNSPIISIWPEDDAQSDIIYNQLVDCNIADLVIYKKDGPELKQFHYSDNRRIAPIILSSKPNADGKSAKLIYLNRTESWSEAGDHGWDNKWERMHATFMARGPSFKTGHSHPPFENVNVYPLVCEILGVECPANNGSLSVVRDMLVDLEEEESRDIQLTLVTYILVALLCASVGGVFMIALCRHQPNMVPLTYAHQSNLKMRSSGNGKEESVLLTSSLASSDDEF